MSEFYPTQLERALIASAAGGLIIAREMETTDASGLDALLASMAVRRPRIFGQRLMESDPEVADRFRQLGEIIEQIAETVDPEG